MQVDSNLPFTQVDDFLAWMEINYDTTMVERVRLVTMRRKDTVVLGRCDYPK